MKKIFFALNIFTALVLVACSGNKNEKEATKDTAEEDTLSTNEKEVAEESPKRKLLTSMIGKHKLSSITGVVGANGMFDIYLENGSWKGEGSANEGGVREGYDLELSDVELSKLNSMCIVVAEDLTVTLESNGKVFCKIPFDENLKALKLDSSKEYAKFDAIPADLSEEKAFFNSWHYLLVRDDYSEAEMKELDIPQSFIPDFVCLKVSETLKEFQVEMRYGDCCDQETYSFSK